MENLIVVVIALLLFVFLGVILRLRAAQGFVDREALQLAGWVILRFALLPFFVFALLKRWLYTRRAGALHHSTVAGRH